MISPLTADEHSDPLTPGGFPLLEDMGVFAGVGGSFQSGTFYTACPCDFIDGTGFNYYFGLLYEKEWFPGFRYGADLIYKNNSLSSSYIEIEPVTAKSTVIENKEEMIPVTTRHTADFSISYLSFQPYLKYYPFKGFYFKLGFAASMPIGSSITHTQELLQRTVLMSTGEIGIVYLTDKSGNITNDTKVTISDSEYPKLNTIQLGLVPAFGFDIYLSKKSALSPSFRFYIPLTSISQYSNPPSYASPVTDFSIFSWSLRLEYRHTLLSNERLRLIPDE